MIQKHTPSDRLAVSLDWAVNKFGPDFFTVRGRWEKNPSVFRDEKRSNLEDGGDWYLGQIAAGIRNLGKMIKGTDESTVRVFAEMLVVRITPKQRHMKLPVMSKFRTMSEAEPPAIPDNQEIEIPTYCISATSFSADQCRRDILDQLFPLGLPEPEMDYGGYWPKTFK